MKKVKYLSGVALLVLVLFAGCAGGDRTATQPATQPGQQTTAEATPAQPAPVVPQTIPVAAPARTNVAPQDTVHAGRFDNGKMWTFDAPPAQYFREEYGIPADAKWFERARLSALRMPGCTASFVSPNGLVMTNHHCGRTWVTSVSQGSEDLSVNGFYSKSIAEERKVPNLYMDQLVEITDVTAEINAAVEGKQTDAERVAARQEAMDRIVARLTQQAGGEQAGAFVQVITLYNGGRYSAYRFHRYKDVRLVMAPELQLGFFGGDPDNFTYPRYALDMTFFRVYGPDGRPLKTDNYFKWSANGTKEGDATFVVGNPGSTNRLETVAQLEFRRDVQEADLLNILRSRLSILRDYYRQNPSPELLNQVFSLSNSEKLYGGRVKGLNDPVLMARRRDTERQFREAINNNAQLKAQYGDLIDRMADIQRQKMELAREYGAFLSLSPNSSLASAFERRALLAAALLNQQGGANAQQIREQLLATPDQPREIDERYLAARLSEFQKYLGENDQTVRAILNGRTPEQAARQLYETSAFASAAKTRAAVEGNTLANDPGVAFVRSFMQRFQNFQSAMAGLNAQQTEIGARLGRARYDVYGTAIPPDATFSLRIQDGVVKGYPYNGTIAPPHTTFYGLYDRYYSFGPGTDWDLPKRWLNPPASFDMSTEMNLVATNDIIGGNSGSPMVNTNLEVVGLVFDGNIESLPSSFIYTTDDMRAVAVDSRGIIESLDDIYDMDRMVLELRTGRAVATEQEADAAR